MIVDSVFYSNGLVCVVCPVTAFISHLNFCSSGAFPQCPGGVSGPHLLEGSELCCRRYTYYL